MKLSFHNIYHTFLQWKNHSIVQQYGVNTFWSLFARGLWILTAFSVGILVTRKLGPEQFGILNYSIAWIGMFAVILDLGVSGIIQRELVNHPEQRDDLLGNFACFRIIQTGFLLLIAGVTLLLTGQTPEVTKLILILMAGYLFSFGAVTGTYFTANVQSKYEAFSQIISCFLYNSVRCAAVVFEWDLAVYAAAESLLLISYNISLLCFYSRKADSLRKWKFRFKSAFALLLPAIPLSLSGIFITIYNKTDILMLEYFQGFEDIAFYSLATRFTLNLSLFSGLIATIFSAAIAGAKKVSDEEYKKQLHRFYFLLFWFMIPFFPLFWIVSPYLFPFLYGDAFSAASDVFSVYICSLPFTGVMNAFFWHSTLENRLKSIAFANGAGALINVGLNCFMIPAMGIVGAAWSSVGAMPMGFLLVLLCTKQGRSSLKLILHSLITLPSFRLRKEC